jgi:hypothetical protein
VWAAAQWLRAWEETRKRRSRSLAPRCVSARKRQRPVTRRLVVFFSGSPASERVYKFGGGHAAAGGVSIRPKNAFVRRWQRKNRLGKSRPIESGRGVCVKSTHTRAAPALQRRFPLWTKLMALTSGIFFQAAAACFEL